jgi:DMSO/TMAO reductase YedYZ molybdopterin-dependent catalytic subunit
MTLDFETMTRRDFVRFLAVLTLAIVAPNSADGKAIRHLLENEDREGFYIRFIKPTEPIDGATWRLDVGGLCDTPRRFTLADLRKLSKEMQVSRLTCVEGWSSKARWGGFRAKTLFDAVKPKTKARFLYFDAADGYYEYIPLEILLKPRVLFVYDMNGAPLPDDYGGPFRLIMPSKYGYKSVKSILKLQFVETDGEGHWVKAGYSKDGTIQPGTDYALDLKTYKLIKEPGEPDY